MKIAGICFTQNGMQIAEKLHQHWLAAEENRIEAAWFCKGKFLAGIELPDHFRPFAGSVQEWAKAYFHQADALIFVSSTGIAVRSIASSIGDKYTDPAVIVIDEKGKFCISLLSGHIGGANALTEGIADVLQSTPVITTATDLNRRFAVDVFAKKHHLKIADRTVAKDISAAILAGKKIGYQFGDICDEDIKALDADLQDPALIKIDLEGASDIEHCFVRETDHKYEMENGQKAMPIEIGMVISHSLEEHPFLEVLYLIPKDLYVGIGCKKGTPIEVIEEAVEDYFADHKLFMQAIRSVATIDIKKDEDGLKQFCEKYELPMRVYTAEQLSSVKGEFTSSVFVKKITGVDNVCERAAACSVLKEQDTYRLIGNKIGKNGVTIAVALK